MDLEVAFTKGFLQGSQRPKYGSRPSNNKATIVLSSNWHYTSKIFPFFWKVKMVLLHQTLFNQSDYTFWMLGFIQKESSSIQEHANKIINFCTQMWNSHSQQRICWIAILSNCLLKDAAWWYPWSTRATSLSGNTS